MKQAHSQLSAQGVTGNCNYDYQPGNTGTIYISGNANNYTWYTRMNSPSLWFSYDYEVQVENNRYDSGSTSNQPSGFIVVPTGFYVGIYVSAYGVGVSFGTLGCRT